MSDPRVLIISHGHPDFSIGGGEIAAYAQFTDLRRRGIDAMFIARTGLSLRHVGAAFSNRTADGTEVLFSAPPVDLFRHSQPVKRVIHREFRALLERFRPTAVHFHHYVHLGLEMIREVRKFMPGGKIILTLHEFLAICHADGQMLKTTGILCSKAASLDCHQCFPSVTPQDFFMRELFIKSFFNLCDHFICPSAFLRDRYIEWGLPPHKMVSLDNGQPVETQPVGTMNVAVSADASLFTRFLVLGQLSNLKGTLLVLQAARLLPKRLQRLVSIEIHGSLQTDREEFVKEFNRGLQGLEHVARYCGPYRRADVTDIIQRNGWVIQPSLWWENSPLVIQEAFAAGRPVICSNVGGMAEKVIDRVSGLHFRVGSASDLAGRIEEAATQPDLWDRLRKNVPRPSSMHTVMDELLDLYRDASSEF